MMIVRTLSLALGGVLATLTASAVAQPQCLSLPSAISTALDVDPRIRASQADRDIARADVMAAQSRNLPQVQVFGRTGRGDNPQLVPTQQDQLGLQATQEFYSFGQRRFATDAARARADAAKFAVDEAALNVAQGVALAWLDLQRAERILIISQDQEAAFARDAEAARVRLERQVITLTDASQLQARLAIARSRRITAEVDVETARVRLAVLTDQPAGCIDAASMETFVGKDADWLLSMPMDAAMDEAFARSAGLRSARAQIEAARARVGEAGRANLPTLSGFALQIYSYDRAFEENPIFPDRERIEDETRLGLTLNQNIFTGGRTEAQRASARARLKRARSDFELEEIIVEDLVKRALAQARAQQKAGLELLSASEQAKAQLDATLTEYQRNTKTLTDLALAYETYFTTLRDETEARFQFYSSLIRLYAAMGTLTDGLDR